jgi:hypothetical protein
MGMLLSPYSSSTRPSAYASSWRTSQNHDPAGLRRKTSIPSSPTPLPYHMPPDPIPHSTPAVPQPPKPPSSSPCYYSNKAPPKVQPAAIPPAKIVSSRAAHAAPACGRLRRRRGRCTVAERRDGDIWRHGRRRAGALGRQREEHEMWH